MLEDVVRIQLNSLHFIYLYTTKWEKSNKNLSFVVKMGSESLKNRTELQIIFVSFLKIKSMRRIQGILQK